MSKYIERIVDSELAQLLETFGAVLIEGPKWCGKTTTAKKHARSSLMLANPENDFAARTLAELDPSLAIDGKAPRLLDEWQEVPKLWDAVRYACDEAGLAGRYILTGSATPRDEDMPMHSGVGRFARLSMSTMSLQEIGVSSGAAGIGAMFGGETFRGLGNLNMKAVAELVVRGGWPSVVGKSTDAAQMLAREYLDAVCESDMSTVDGVRRDPHKVRSLLRSLARNESTLASMKAVLKDVADENQHELTRVTASTYVSVLRRLHLIEDIPAWDPALRSPVALRSAKKHHFADASLAAAAIGASVDSLILDPKTLGLLFESLVLHDLLVYARSNDADVFHYHDMSDLEADAVIAKRNGDWIVAEIKLGAAQIEEGCANVCKVEEKMVRAGNKASVRKCVIVGFGAPAHVTQDGVQIIPVDMLGV